MTCIILSGAAEIAPKDIPGECWYLPLFGVYHPRKPDQIRGVFDSSAIFEGVSLNVESHFSSKKEIVCPQQTVLLCYRLKFSQKCHL
jgi:hypothetical protein